MSPITAAGIHTATFNMAKVRPTARASMLVATENTTRLQPRVGSPRSARDSSDADRASRMAFTPMKESSPKAIQ